MKAKCYNITDMNDTQTQQLEKLKEKIGHCTKCQKDTIGVMVFGEGNPNAKIMFVGEAPGKQEAASGRPFIGRSGKLLRSMIRDTGIKENEVYITSPVKYLPKRGTPSKKQIEHARKPFLEQIAIIDPELIVLLGKTAISAVLQQDISVLKEHGTVFRQDGRNILITLHPAAVLRFPKKYKELFTNDFRKITTLVSTP